MRSGVDVPERKAGEMGESGERNVGDFGIVRVVLRWRFVVSEDGGGGRWAIEKGERTKERQRKHSPVPK